MYAEAEAEVKKQWKALMKLSGNDEKRVVNMLIKLPQTSDGSIDEIISLARLYLPAEKAFKKDAQENEEIG